MPSNQLNMSTSSPANSAGVQVNHARTVNNNENRSVEDLNQHTRRVQELVEQVNAMPDLAARALLQDCLQSVLELHGQGLARVLEIAEDGGPGRREVFDRLIQDSVVRGLLLIHGLHPVSLEVRLQEALNKLRPYMESHGGNVELISLENDFARLRLQGACKTCPSSSVTMELAVRHALEEACPDLMGFEVEGTTSTSTPGGPLFDDKPQSRPEWITVGGPGELSNCNARVIEAGSTLLIICKVNHNLYAYGNGCPACGQLFKAGEIKEGLLKCPQGHAYDPQHAGAGIENPDYHLDPIPLLVENGQVKVCVR